MASNPPEGVPQVYPRLVYRDPTEAVAWLRRAFGLVERESSRFSTKDGRIIVAEMELGAGLVMIGQSGAHGLESPAASGCGSQMVMVYVDDVAGHHARAREAGARIVAELKEQPWGDRRYEALDLEGHRWHFAEHLRDVAPDTWKAAVTS